MTAAAPAASSEAPSIPSRGAVAQFWERLRKKKLAMLSLVVITTIYAGGEIGRAHV